MGKEKEDLTDFCRHKSLRLSVDPGIAGDEFRKARDKALLDACSAWNHIDGTPKLRMKLHEVKSFYALQLAKQQRDINGSGFVSDSESEAGSDADINPLSL